MKFLNLKRALCLSPHPDDVEIGMLGTIFRHNETKFDILCLTKGGAKGYDETNELDRRKEVDNVWSFWENLTDHVKVYHSKYDYFEDCTEPGWINYIEKNVLLNYLKAHLKVFPYYSIEHHQKFHIDTLGLMTRFL